MSILPRVIALLVVAVPAFACQPVTVGEADGFGDPRGEPAHDSGIGTGAEPASRIASPPRAELGGPPSGLRRFDRACDSEAASDAATDAVSDASGQTDAGGASDGGDSGAVGITCTWRHLNFDCTPSTDTEYDVQASLTLGVGPASSDSAGGLTVYFVGIDELFNSVPPYFVVSDATHTHYRARYDAGDFQNWGHAFRTGNTISFSLKAARGDLSPCIGPSNVVECSGTTTLRP